MLPVTVVTSDELAGGSNGWAAADGDLDTLWTGTSGAGGWYIVLGYDPPLELTNLVVHLAAGSTSEFRYLHSMDAVEWRDLTADLAVMPVVELRYLWLAFPGYDSFSPGPAVQEIVPQLKK